MNYMKILGILNFFLVLIIGVGAYLFVQVYRSQPEKSGLVHMPSLKKTVKVTKDKWGIPHIYASDEEHGLKVLGHQMASERLFQMDLLRRSSFCQGVFQYRHKYLHQL